MLLASVNMKNRINLVEINFGGSKIVLNLMGINFGGSQMKFFSAGTNFGGSFTNPPKSVPTKISFLKAVSSICTCLVYSYVPNKHPHSY